jgi:nucleoside-diphosphate-sugar epimerase
MVDTSGIQIAEAIRRVVGNPRLPIRSFPWWAIYAASPFVAMFREMIEMRYLWREPVRLDNAKLKAFLGSEPHTPIDQAIATTLRGLGCLKATDAPPFSTAA